MIIAKRWLSSIWNTVTPVLKGSSLYSESLSTKGSFTRTKNIYKTLHRKLNVTSLRKAQLIWLFYDSTRNIWHIHTGKRLTPVTTWTCFTVYETLPTSPSELPNVFFNVLKNNRSIKCIFFNLYCKSNTIDICVWNAMSLVYVICKDWCRSPSGIDNLVPKEF